MNKILKQILFLLLFPFSRVIRLVQNQMDFLRTYKLKLIIARVLRVVRVFNGTAGSVQYPDSVYPTTDLTQKTKIGIIDHSYHFKTDSPGFFINLLRPHGSVRVMWDSKWNGGKSPSIATINEHEFDILILWQIMIYHDPEKLKKLNCKQIIIVPMYDDIHADPDKLFLGFRNFRFISFCRDLQQRFDLIGIRSKYFQFYIDPASLPFTPDPFTELKGFFWQRTNDITWDHIKKLIEGSHFSSFHLHLALDPIWYREILPTEEEMKKYRVTITRWFDRKEDYLSVLSRANVFFTPRLYEGIGMPVIESMTMGKVVVTPDHPTMNEYITHGKNGLLYDVKDLKPLDFAQAGTMAARAREDCISGFDKWQQDRSGILSWVKNDNTPGMSEQHKFSVITPSYNQFAYLPRTIESVLGQQVNFPVEYLVIDGGSTDGTLDVLKMQADRLRYVSETDRGMADALNKGFSMATGEIVGWLNSDDLYLPGALQKAAEYFNAHPESLWLYGNCRMIDEKDREVRKWITNYKNRLARRYSYKRLLGENFISQPAVFIRRAALIAAGPIDVKLPTAMDYDLWLRLANLGHPGYIDDDLACFRVHNQSISSLNYKEQFKEQYRIHERYDQNRWRLLKHRMTNRVIVFIYSLLATGKALLSVRK